MSTNNRRPAERYPESREGEGEWRVIVAMFAPLVLIGVVSVVVLLLKHYWGS